MFRQLQRSPWIVQPRAGNTEPPQTLPPS
jgi:hypothetical protein